MSTDVNNSKSRLNLYIGNDLLDRLKYCSARYGVSHAQLAVILIGQGVSGIEKSFTVFDNVSSDILKDINIKKIKESEDINN